MSPTNQATTEAVDGPERHIAVEEEEVDLDRIDEGERAEGGYPDQRAGAAQRRGGEAERRKHKQHKDLDAVTARPGTDQGERDAGGEAAQPDPARIAGLEGAEETVSKVELARPPTAIAAATARTVSVTPPSAPAHRKGSRTTSPATTPHHEKAARLRKIR